MNRASPLKNSGRGKGSRQSRESSDWRAIEIARSAACPGLDPGAWRGGESADQCCELTAAAYAARALRPRFTTSLFSAFT